MIQRPKYDSYFNTSTTMTFTPMNSRRSRRKFSEVKFQMPFTEKRLIYVNGLQDSSRMISKFNSSLDKLVKGISLHFCFTTFRLEGLSGLHRGLQGREGWTTIAAKSLQSSYYFRAVKEGEFPRRRTIIWTITLPACRCSFQQLSHW